MALGNADFTQLFASSLQKYEKQLADNVILTHPTLELFKENAKSNTGRGLVIPVRAAALNGTGYSDDSGTHGTDVTNDLIGAAVFDWSKEVITPFRVKHREILQNSGPEQVINLVEEYVKGATASHQDFIVAELWASVTGTGDILSLRDLISPSDKKSDSTAITVGGIRGGQARRSVTNFALTSNVATLTVGLFHDYIIGDSIVVAGVVNGVFNGTFVISAVAATTVSYALTNANIASTAATAGTVYADAIKDFWKSSALISARTGNGSEDILAAFRKLTNDIYAKSRKKPTHIIAGFNVYEEMEAYLATNGRTLYNMPASTAETRFQEISFNGVPVRLDPDCPVDEAYFIFAPALRFAYLAGEFMKTYPGQRVQGKLDEVVPIASTLSIGTSERRAHGKLIRIASFS
jgi:hypothetical protein